MSGMRRLSIISQIIDHSLQTGPLVGFFAPASSTVVVHTSHVHGTSAVAYIREERLYTIGDFVVSVFVDDEGRW